MSDPSSAPAPAESGDLKAARERVRKAQVGLRGAKDALRKAERRAAAQRREAIRVAMVASVEQMPASLGFDVPRLTALLQRVAEKKLPHSRLAELVEAEPAAKS